jgi:dipeptidyl aminopeptidase/acylaminoacyl peptidase
MDRELRIESLLAARLFLSPQLVGDRILFISDLSGRLSLYTMARGGSVPQPLLPPNIALQNPTLLGGYSYAAFPDLDQVVIMIDRDGDENYQPMVVPIEGGIPEPLLGDKFAGEQLLMSHFDVKANVAVFQIDHRTRPEMDAMLIDLASNEWVDLGQSLYGNYFNTASDDYSTVILSDGYTAGDTVLYLWEEEHSERRLLYGTPIDAREEGQTVPLTGFMQGHLIEETRSLLIPTVLFDDLGGLGYLRLDNPTSLDEIEIAGTIHEGVGEFHGLEFLEGDRYLLEYNIDGVSWAYEARFDPSRLRMDVEDVLVGENPLSGGVTQWMGYEEVSGDFVLSFSTATSPAQIYTLEGPDRAIIKHTTERVLGIPEPWLSPGEDASYVSYDGLRVSARLYMPSSALGYTGKRPVVFYIHGGPQSQERPDFTWFSMPLIQFFTLNGFAVFVPNVRGSEGYGMTYMKKVDQDWGGDDRLDHVAGYRALEEDPRLDMDRVGVMGRSYGGYMTLMLIGRHPELWSAACDMFGPYSLFTFLERIPETWKTYFYMSIGHPERDSARIKTQSPDTYLDNLACPMLVIQGRNDPRVVAEESEDLVRELQAKGKDVEILVMENEGHDVIKYENKVWIYNAIVDFFREELGLM